MNQDVSWLPAREASALLGVKRATLYAYASRGLVRVTRGADGRERLYARTDLERLKARADARSGHGPVAAGALRFGEPVLETSITEITPEGPSYRGHRAVDLALDGAGFEVAAELLWSGHLPDERPRFVGPTCPRLLKDVAALVRDPSPLAPLEPLAAGLAARDEARCILSPERERERAGALVRSLAAGLGVGADPRRAAASLGEERVAAILAAALTGRASARAVEALDRALVLIADHELNASTFAVRVAASTGADLYACVRAGLATLSGPRHGGACDRMEALVREAGRPARAREVLLERLARGEAAPGFGHPLYPSGDPRAAPLLEARVVTEGRGEALRTLLALVDAAAAAGLPGPTVDTGLVALSLALKLPPGSAAGLFAVGRAAGWAAHALEQRESAELLRPRARYVGPPRP